MPEQLHNHILIIEDDPGIAISLRSGLEREGFQVTWKELGEAGISFAQTQNPDLIILDRYACDPGFRVIGMCIPYDLIKGLWSVIFIF